MKWYLAFADLSIIFLVQSLNGRFSRDTDSLVMNTLVTWGWEACDHIYCVCIQQDPDDSN